MRKSSFIGLVALFALSTGCLKDGDSGPQLLGDTEASDTDSTSDGTLPDGRVPDQTVQPDGLVVDAGADQGTPPDALDVPDLAAGDTKTDQTDQTEDDLAVDTGPETLLPIQCEEGTADCDQDNLTCEVTLGTVQHCGGCYDSCSTNHSAPTCVDELCVHACEVGWADCNQNPLDGCEQSLMENSNCGVCGYTCVGQCMAGGCIGGCDTNLTVESSDPMDGAKALGLCDNVVSAKWVQPDGANPPASFEASFALGHGILTGFGPNVTPQEGARILVLSSGTARQPTDPGYSSPKSSDKGYTCNSPAGFPMESPMCPGVTTGQPHDGVALELELTVPPFAVGYSFVHSFYTYEWPQYICSQFNDFFLAIQDPAPAGSISGNVAFDAQGNPVSVNNAFIDVCGCNDGPPCMAGGKEFTCSLGTLTLIGTGFGPDTDDAAHGATGWLRTTAPVEPGTQFKLRFTVYDSGDGILDSTVLLDEFEWVVDPVVVGTTPEL